MESRLMILTFLFFFLFNRPTLPLLLGHWVSIVRLQLITRGSCQEEFNFYLILLIFRSSVSSVFSPPWWLFFQLELIVELSLCYCLSSSSPSPSTSNGLLLLLLLLLFYHYYYIILLLPLLLETLVLSARGHSLRHYYVVIDSIMVSLRTRIDITMIMIKLSYCWLRKSTW